MLANLNRDEFVALLNKLGSENDAEVLSVARDLHAKVTVAGVTWDALLAPDRPNDDAGDEGDDEAPQARASSGGNDDTLVAPNADHGALSDAEKDEARQLIDAIGKMQISDQTRAELADHAADLLDGRMEQMDLRYLRALSRRLAS